MVISEAKQTLKLLASLDAIVVPIHLPSRSHCERKEELSINAVLI